MQRHNITDVKVPQPYYNISNYGSFEGTGYEVANYDVLNIATISTLQGQILTSPSQYANQSYGLNFYGPGIKCDRANSSLIDTINSVYGHEFKRITCHGPTDI